MKISTILVNAFGKLYYKQWMIGLYKGSINQLIESKTFDPEIKWICPKSLKKYDADPFLLSAKDHEIKILFEEFKLKQDYGNISLLTVDKNFKKISSKVLLDTESHLSYPFIFEENGKCYVFPEAAQSKKFSCYQFDPVKEELIFQKDILNLPLLDSTIIKHNNKYWLFSTIGDNKSGYELHVFFSEQLLGPYFSHPKNPVKCGTNGIRSAGRCVKINGNIYRPTQNCEKKYGDSITINKINRLTEEDIHEEEYFAISLNSLKNDERIASIHTINELNNLVVLDAQRWTFSPRLQFRKFIKDNF